MNRDLCGVWNTGIAGDEASRAQLRHRNMQRCQ
jgi:hypothetical protein